MNNWLSFSNSPNDEDDDIASSFPHEHLQHASLTSDSTTTELVPDHNAQQPLQIQDWSLINSQTSDQNHVPKVADFLGVGILPDNIPVPEFPAAFGQILRSSATYAHTDHYAAGAAGYTIQSEEEAVGGDAASAAGEDQYRYQLGINGRSNVTQPSSLTLSMGNTIGDGRTTSSGAEGGGAINTAVAEGAARRPSVDTFGQRTSIYRGVTR